jgi:hypothetical protein
MLGPAVKAISGFKCSVFGNSCSTQQFNCPLEIGLFLAVNPKPQLGSCDPSGTFAESEKLPATIIANWLATNTVSQNTMPERKP